jgi:hypothetical protein
MPKPQYRFLYHSLQNFFPLTRDTESVVFAPIRAYFATSILRLNFSFGFLYYIKSVDLQVRKIRKG